jgi:hypothetical protein
VADVSFQSLSPDERRDALEVAAGLSGRRAHLLEKDIWVVQTLAALIETPFGADLTFKGGTSLAKAYHAIRRFSEDLDITYDIRAIAPDLLTNGGDEAIPATRSQERRWSREIRRRLPGWVVNQALPSLEINLAEAGLSAELRAEGDHVFVAYEPLFDDYGFVRPEVVVEFGARSIGDPREERLCGCDAASYVPDVAFPSVRPFVMSAERTFWEKATAVHVFCQQQRSRGERLSRHWYDLVRLDDIGYAERALSNRALALSVSRHKSMFFREKDSAGSWVDYEAAVSGGLQLVPAGPAYRVLSDDYDRMLTDGMLLDDEEQFDDLMERCADIQRRANGR